jgi:sterol desaturase/sphingolipid hydroxylase (fatty acid hydroxylase superfamily)
MRMRRNLYIVLSILSLAITFLVWWMLVQADDLLSKVSCARLSRWRGSCETQDRYSTPWMMVLVFGVGGLITLGFAVLAWLDTVMLRADERQQKSVTIIPSTGMVIVRSGDDQTSVHTSERNLSTRKS